MNELQQFIRDYPDGYLGLGRWLMSQPQFQAFNMLWDTPRVLPVMVDYFGLTTIAEAEAFAASMMDGSIWRDEAKRVQLIAWINPRPGFMPDWREFVPKNIAFVEEALTNGQVPTAPNYWVIPVDGTVWLGTEAQYATIMANCPAKRHEWHAIEGDCDSQTAEMIGWLAKHGLDQLAIGFGGYQAYKDLGAHLPEEERWKFLGAHMIGLAVTTEKKVVILEPRDGMVYPITKLDLGGFVGANRVAYTCCVII